VRTAAGGAPPMSVNSTAKVANLNADFVDGLDPGRFVVGEAGGRLLANRLAPAVPGRVLLGIPGMGLLSVDSCDGSVGGLVFDTAGTGKVDLMFSGIAANPSGGLPGIGPDIDSVITDRWQLPSTRVGPTTWGGYTLNIARDTGLGTKIATIWVNWYAVGCRFQAQAIESPQL